MKTKKVKLVSFAEGPFAPRKAGFLREALKLGNFDEVKVFDYEGLAEDFRERHRNFVYSNSRGFGYWIWKPQVILEVLECSGADDFVIYMDSGFTLNSNGIHRFLEYLELTLDSEWKMLSFQNIHTEYKWTKMDLAKRLGVHECVSIMKTSQLASGFVVMMATPENKQLVADWAKIAVEEEYHYSDDSPSLEENHPFFVEHRHDASIFSLLRKIRGTAVTHYEVQSYPHFQRQKLRLPAWATRSRL